MPGQILICIVRQHIFSSKHTLLTIQDYIGSTCIIDKGKTFADIGQFVLTVGKIWSDLKTLSKLHGQVWQNFDR